MTKFFISLLIILSVPVFAQQKTQLPSIERILQQPEDSINIGVACLSLAQEFYPDMNPDFFLYSFDYMADRIKHYFGHITDPDKKIRALNSYLYQKGFWNDSITFTYDYDDLQGLKRDNRFINGYIARKKGTCVTMPMLYLILGERLNMPMKAVRAPNHFFIRYYPEVTGLDWQSNVETTSGGGYSPDDAYIEDMQIPDLGIETGMYLRTLGKKEYLASLLLLNAAEYMELKQFDKAQHYTELAIKYDSTLATAIWAYGLVHYKRAWDLREKMDSEIQTERIVLGITARNRTASSRNPSNQEPRKVLHKSDINIDIEFRKYAAGLIPELKIPTQQQLESNQTMNQQPMSNELFTEIQMIQDQYLPLIEKNLEVWYTSKQKAKDMGMAFGPQTEFFKKQTIKLKEFAMKGVK